MSSAETVIEECLWPCLTKTHIGLIVAYNIASIVLIYIVINCVLGEPNNNKPKPKPKDPESGATETTRLLEAGEVAGDYSEPWTKTFDFTFMIFMIVFLVGLLVVTYFTMPELFHNGKFWLQQLPKVGGMIIVSLLGGILCRAYCPVDESGYIITSKASWFKVNYTRKLQHFAAYAIPMLMKADVTGPLAMAWGDWFTLLGFFILIKPIRERSSFFMLQFNSLDRPEDRPNTIKWIVGGNIIPGLCMILLFRYLYAPTAQQSLSMIFVLITGIGDGLAEPVGITWGRHKYWTAGCFGGDKYQRSWEGSACVFYSGIFFCSVMWYAFANATQFWIASAALAPLMAYAEATSPHTMDTPFLMGLGGLVLWGVTFIH